MRKSLITLGILALGIPGLAYQSEAPCAGSAIVVTHSCDKTLVNPGDAFLETTTIMNTGGSQATLTTIGRMESPDDVYDLTTHMDTTVLNPGKSRSFYAVYHMPCVCAPGVYTINRRVLTGANVYTPPCYADNISVTVTSNPVCP
jgi:hypothetical protein